MTASRYHFTRHSLETIDHLIDESEDAFLASYKNPSSSTSALMRMFSQNDPLFTVLGFANEEGAPVSYIVALSGATSDTLAIGPMYVGMNWRGQGLGKRQVEKFIHYAKNHHYRNIFTKTWSSNQASNAIFTSLGFGIQATIKNDRINGDDTLTYGLSVDRT